MSHPRSLPKIAAALLLGLGALVALADTGAPEPWKAPAEASQIQNPLSFSPETLAAGQKVYEKRCLNCHGAGGKGDGRGAAFMKVKPTDLTAAAVREQSDGELFWKITTGRRPMPDFASKLDDDSRWQAVLYLRALGDAAAAEAGAADPGAGGQGTGGSGADGQGADGQGTGGEGEQGADGQGADGQGAGGKAEAPGDGRHEAEGKTDAGEDTGGSKDEPHSR